MTPHEALKAAVEERMRLAREATGRQWKPMAGKYGAMGIEGVFAVHHRDRGYQPSGADEAFIAANDPAFVLRQCERDLKVLERHQPVHMKPPVACAWCKAPSDAFPDVPWPCREFRDLAEVYQIDLGVSDES